MFTSKLFLTRLLAAFGLGCSLVLDTVLLGNVSLSYSFSLLFVTGYFAWVLMDTKHFLELI
jgi:hypothetical protein